MEPSILRKSWGYNYLLNTYNTFLVKDSSILFTLAIPVCY